MLLRQRIGGSVAATSSTRASGIAAARVRQQQQHEQARRRAPLIVNAAAAERADGGGSGGDAAAKHGALTERLVGFSSIPFTFIVVPQVLQNQAFIASGQLSALASISWVGWSAGLAGNALMCTYLASRQEATAVRVQLIGIASNLAVLGQLWYAAVMPTSAFAGALCACAAIAVACVLRSTGRLSARAWLPFEALVGAAGAAGAPQVLWSAVAPGAASLVPSLLGGAAAAMWLQQQGAKSRDALSKAIAQLPGWCATAMFTLSPLPQLVHNFCNLSDLAGLSLGTMLLAMLGNAACIPRALFTRDRAWTWGSTWGCVVMGWAQCLSLCLGVNPATGARFLPAPAFVGLTAAMVVWLCWVMAADAAAKGLRSPLRSYPDVYGLGVTGAGVASL